MNKIAMLFVNLLVLLSVLSGCSSNKSKEVKAGEEFVVKDSLSYEVNRLETIKKLEPSIIDGYYTYYEPKDKSNVLLDLVLNVKNESSTKIDLSNYISLTFNINKKEYEAGLVIEQDGGKNLSSFGELDPMQSTLVHLFTEISEADIPDEVLCELTVNNETSEFKLSRKALAPTKKYLKYGEVIDQKDLGSVTIIKYSITKKLLPPNTDGVYSYYEVKDKNDSYLVLEVKIRNNSGSSVEPEDLVNCRVTVDNKYEYTGFLVYTEEDGDLTSYGSISPLKETTGFFLIQIPDEIINKTIEFKLNIFGDNYYLKK